MAKGKTCLKSPKIQASQTVLLILLFGTFPAFVSAFLPALHASLRIRPGAALFSSKAFVPKTNALKHSSTTFEQSKIFFADRRKHKCANKLGITMADSSRKVCVLGGGFGGLYTALKLAQLSPLQSDVKPDITLVDSNDRSECRALIEWCARRDRYLELPVEQTTQPLQNITLTHDI
jgi:hypothetical protein